MIIGMRTRPSAGPASAWNAIATSLPQTMGSCMSVTDGAPKVFKRLS
jgi:hypothetical protein